LKDIVDLADGERPVQQIAAELHDPADGTVADQGQPEDRLVEPGFGDREVEEHLFGLRIGSEGVVESLLGTADLLVDELTADVELRGQPTDGIRSSQSVQSQVLSLCRLHRPGGGENRAFRLRANVGTAKIGNHVCFLRETG
jgi:hypothetical protein